MSTGANTVKWAFVAVAASSICVGQTTCPQDQPKDVKPPVLAPEGHGVCRYDRPVLSTQPSYWWQLLYELFKWQPVNRPPFRRSVAFLAGVSQYAHISPQLDFVRNDLTEFRNFLLTDGGFDTVYEVRDGNVTREAFDNYMKKYFSDPRGLAGPEDRLLVYYSGHGGAQADSEPYLLFQKAVANDYTKDVLAVRDIYSWAMTIAAKHLLIILDSCFSGLVAAKPGPNDMAAALSNALAGEPSGLLLTAGTGDEEAYAVRYSKEKNGSIFTHALIDALRNMSQSEGIVTIGEAFERAKVSVAVFDAVENRKMTPSPTPLERKNGMIGKGNFIFVNTRAQNPPLPSGLSGQGMSIAKAPDAVDPNLRLIQLEYQEVKNTDDLPSLRAFVASYKDKSFGQTLVGLIEAKINRIEHDSDSDTTLFKRPPVSTPTTPRAQLSNEARQLRDAIIQICQLALARNLKTERQSLLTNSEIKYTTKTSLPGSDECQVMTPRLGRVEYTCFYPSFGLILEKLSAAFPDWRQQKDGSRDVQFEDPSSAMAFELSNHGYRDQIILEISELNR